MTLEQLHNAARVGLQKDYEPYYTGEARLDALGISLPPNARVLELMAPFPKLVVDTYVDMLNPTGFLLAGDPSIPEQLRKWWQANRMARTAKLAMTEALVQGSAFFVVGVGTGDTPRITAHGPRGFAVRRDHMGEIMEAVQTFGPVEDQRVAHYLPDATLVYRMDGATYRLIAADKHGLGRPAVVQMTNRIRLSDRDGRSEIEPIRDVTDAASRTMTNLQVAQELLSMPVRYLFGDGLESMRDQAGNPVDKMSAYFGRYLTGPQGATAGQIPGASLLEFSNTYKTYAQIVSSVTGIPPNMLGVSTDNPTSAEAMNEAMKLLIGRVEEKQTMFGDALEDVARLALASQGVEAEGLELLEQQWRNPAQPSASARNAALLQAHAQGVVSAETAREGLQLTPEQMAREDARRGAALRSARQLGDMEML